MNSRLVTYLFSATLGLFLFFALAPSLSSAQTLIPSVSWRSFSIDPNTGARVYGDLTTWQTGEEVQLPLKTTGQISVSPNISGVLGVHGQLFKVGESGNRVLVSQSSTRSWDYTWTEAGEYEADVYGRVQVIIEVKGPVQKFLAWLFGEPAYALYEPQLFLGTVHFTVTSEGPVCCSSILFLPGIQGSRLYDGDSKLWEPGGESDVQALYLDSNGQSINPNIGATEVIDTFDGPLGINLDIYGSFLESLALKKSEGVIQNYIAEPYDWRLSIHDILEAEDIENKLKSLAASSTTRKVTIIAHSNGGLVAKSLISSLGDGASDLVDQIILVATPQLGTPQAIGSVLHGFDTGIPFLITDARARNFARNAPFAYNLQPFFDFSQNSGFIMQEPLITFEPGFGTQFFIDTYGEEIYSGSKLHSFLIGEEGRSAPEYNDLERPSIGNASLLTQAETFQATINSDWQVPVEIKVHQIGGVGENTVAGITYKTGTRCAFRYLPPGSSIPICLEYVSVIEYTPNEVVNGDGTVLEPSALAISSSTDTVSRWWINLQDFNRVFFGTISKPLLRTNHKDLFKIPELQSFIIDVLLKGGNPTNLSYISGEEPTLSGGSRLRFVLHSPLALSVFDSSGNEISESKSTLPGSTYKRYGEVQVAWVPGDSHPVLHLAGLDEGSFTLDVQEYFDNLLLASSTFSGVLSTSNSKVTMNFPDGKLQSAGPLQVDYDGDETVDLFLVATIGGTTELSAPSLIELAKIAESEARDLKASSFTKNLLLKTIQFIEYKISRTAYINSPNYTQNEKSLRSFFIELIKLLSELNQKGKVTFFDSLKIANILRNIQEVL